MQGSLNWFSDKFTKYLLTKMCLECHRALNFAKEYIKWILLHIRITTSILWYKCILSSGDGVN